MYGTVPFTGVSTSQNTFPKLLCTFNIVISFTDLSIHTLDYQCEQLTLSKYKADGVNHQMGLMQEHFQILVLNRSYFFCELSFPSQTLLTAHAC